MCESSTKWQLCGPVNTCAADVSWTRTCVLLHLTKVLIPGESWASYVRSALGGAAPSPPSGKNTLCQAPRQRCLPACLPATPQGRSKARPRPTPPAGRMSVTPSVGRLSHEGRDIEQWQLSAALAGKQGDFQCWSWHGLKLSEAFWGWFICLSNGNKLPRPQYSQANKRQPKKHS